MYNPTPRLRCSKLFFFSILFVLISIGFSQIAFADKTVTIDELSPGVYEISPDPLIIRSGERVTFHVTDSSFGPCIDGNNMRFTIYADGLFPGTPDPIRFVPTIDNTDFTTHPFEWPPSVSTYTYQVEGWCFPAVEPVFHSSAVFQKISLSPVACIIEQTCGLNFHLPDICELVSGDPCIPEFNGELPDPWGPICLTCPFEIQTQYLLLQNELQDQKISLVGNSIQDLQMENKIIIGLVSVAIVLSAINLGQGFRNKR